MITDPVHCDLIFICELCHVLLHIQSPISTTILDQHTYAKKHFQEPSLDNMNINICKKNIYLRYTTSVDCTCLLQLDILKNMQYTIFFLSYQSTSNNISQSIKTT